MNLYVRAAVIVRCVLVQLEDHGADWQTQTCVQSIHGATPLLITKVTNTLCFQAHLWCKLLLHVVCSDMYMFIQYFVTCIFHSALIYTHTNHYTSLMVYHLCMFLIVTVNVRYAMFLFSRTLLMSPYDTHSHCLLHHVIRTCILLTSSCDTHSFTVYVIIRYSLTDCLRLLMWSLKSSKQLNEIFVHVSLIYARTQQR